MPANKSFLADGKIAIRKLSCGVEKKCQLVQIMTRVRLLNLLERSRRGKIWKIQLTRLEICRLSQFHAEKVEHLTCFRVSYFHKVHFHSIATFEGSDK